MGMKKFITQSNDNISHINLDYFPRIDPANQDYLIIRSFFVIRLLRPGN